VPSIFKRHRFIPPPTVQPDSFYSRPFFPPRKFMSWRNRFSIQRKLCLLSLSYGTPLTAVRAFPMSMSYFSPSSPPFAGNIFCRRFFLFANFPFSLQNSTANSQLEPPSSPCSWIRKNQFCRIRSDSVVGSTPMSPHPCSLLKDALQFSFLLPQPLCDHMVRPAPESDSLPFPRFLKCLPYPHQFLPLWRVIPVIQSPIGNYFLPPFHSLFLPCSASNIPRFSFLSRKTV